MKKIIEAFVNDKTLALVGASANTKKWGYMLTKALIKKGYTVVPVNPNYQEIDGMKCYGSVTEIPSTIQNVIIATPPGQSEKVANDCVAKGIKRVWFIKGGGEGSLSDKALEICRTNNIEVVYGFCPMMFFPPVGIHKLHLKIKEWKGSVPAEYKMH